MSAKPEAKEAPAAPEKEKAPAAEAAAPAKGGGIKAMLPAIIAVVLAPAATFAVTQFVLLPKLEAKLAAPASGAESAHGGGEHAAAEPAHGEKKEKGGHGEKEGASGGNYEFTNVVVNLAGTMGTRYLKASFIVTGAKEAPTKGIFEENKARLTDITLNVLSSLTLADLEEPGSKNVLREKLVGAYNQALGKRIVDQIYFSDFVIQ